MCLGIIGRVVAAHGNRRATVEAGGAFHEVLDLVDLGAGSTVRAIRVGDWVVIHSGFALARITAAEAAEALTIRSHKEATP